MRKTHHTARALLSSITLVVALAACQPGAPSAAVAEAAQPPVAQAQTPDNSATPAAEADPIVEAAQFVASGNEPGWIVHAGPQGMRVKLDYGETLHTVVPVSEGPDGWAGKTDDGTPVRMSVQPVACVDDMSGKPHEAKVMLTVGTRQLHGCGSRVAADAAAAPAPAP